MHVKVTNNINIVTVFVCGYWPPSFKTTNNIATLQKFQLSTVNTGMTLIGIYWLNRILIYQKNIALWWNGDLLLA